MLAAGLPPDTDRDVSAQLCSMALAVLLLVVIVSLGPLQAQKTMTSTGDGNLFRQVLFVLMFGFVILAARGLQTPRVFLVPPATLWLLVGWCWFSLAWSLEPSIAVRRLLLTTIVIWSIFLIVQRAGPERTIKTTILTLLAVLVINYAMIVLFPTASIHQARDVLDQNLVGDWKGVMPQKNYTGAVCAITFLMLVFAGGWIMPVLRIAFLLATAFFLFKTGSKTSQALTIGCLIIGGLYLAYDPKFRALLAPGAIIGVGVAILLGQFVWGDALAEISRGDALTGRGKIWSVLVDYASDHWLLGAGYGSFWNIGQDSPVYDYTSSWVRALGTGHNGYLDMLVTTGSIGLFLTVAALIIAPLSRLLWSRTIPRGQGALLIALLCFCIGHNFTESSVMDRDSIVQVFFMLVLALITVCTRPPPAPPAPLYFAWTGRFRPRAETQVVPSHEETFKP
ncbi:MAG: hypothetical protein A2352_03045 [Caulobacterales bacterium RIFOXYB1_FULL_67_16]|nr:MAG: hypothetical protein A2352_03045 [Caulobacterales bacterium RIFOXYB1_FULL_67_16]